MIAGMANPRTAAQGSRRKALAARGAAVDWESVHEALDHWGFARIPRLLAARECAELASLYDSDARFRKTVSMDAHRFGSGEYRYLRYPLPTLVQDLRQGLYPPLARIANAWQKRLGDPHRYEPTLSRFLGRCHARGQSRPTPLLLRYVAGGFNNLHQDLYGPVAFPLQVTVLLSRPRIDFEGGEFLLVEQRPRQQSRGCAVALERGEAIVFATHERPVDGARGPYRAAVRHGVSPLLGGRRTALGIIFHDAA
jgi:uncharacterized protein